MKMLFFCYKTVAFSPIFSPYKTYSIVKQQQKGQCINKKEVIYEK